MNKENFSPVTATKKTRWRKLVKSKWTYLVILVLAIGGFYYYRQINQSFSETKYVLAAASRATVVNTVSGTGEISAANQIDLVPEVSGEILSLSVKAGQKVKSGEVIARIDDSDAQSQVRQAKNSLDSARASLASKLAGPSEEEIAVSKKSIESAKMSYDNSVNNLEYVKQANEDSLTKAQLNLDNATLSLANAQRSYDNAVSNSGIASNSDINSLDKAYSEAKNVIAAAQVSLRSALVSADNILEKNNYNSSTHNYKTYLGVRDSQTWNAANNAYDAAKASYSSLSSSYSSASASWTEDNIEEMLAKTKTAAELMQSLSSAVSNVLLNSITATDFSQSSLDAYKQTASSQESSMISLSNSLQSSLQSISNAKLNSSSSNLSVSASVENAKAALESANNNLTSARNALAQTKSDNQKSLDSANNDVAAKKNSYESSQAQFNLKIAKPRSVELTSYYLQISSAETNYQEALEKLADTEVKSPIDGMIAEVKKKAGDSVRDSDSGDPIATIITEEKLAVVSLNEVDVAKVAVGQKANITLSALEDLAITGTVVEIESIGTANQGVVSYEVKIVLDVQDERIKPQMTVSADIIVARSADVITIPNAALKSNDNGGSYVEILSYDGEPDSSGVSSSQAPESRVVDTGISDDTNTEIKSGLDEGEYVVVRTISSTVSAASSSNKSSAASLLSGNGMGGAMRAASGGSPAGGPPGM